MQNKAANILKQKIYKFIILSKQTTKEYQKKKQETPRIMNFLPFFFLFFNEFQSIGMQIIHQEFFFIRSYSSFNLRNRNSLVQDQQVALKRSRFKVKGKKKI